MTFRVYLQAYEEDAIEIYLRVPEGMIQSEDEPRKAGGRDASDMFLRLVKSLYGPKQVVRLWNPAPSSHADGSRVYAVSH